MKKLIALILCAVSILSAAACTFAEPEAQTAYILEVGFEAKIEDGEHNADVKLHKLIFPENTELESAVNEVVYDPFGARYSEYRDSAPIEFNYFCAENQIYESDKYLSIASLSYREGTYVTYPFVAGVVVDLETQRILADDALLNAFGTDISTAKGEIENMLVAMADEYSTTYIVCDFADAYLNANGELIVMYPYEMVGAVMPSNPYLYYNVSAKTLCHDPSAKSFEELDKRFVSISE